MVRLLIILLLISTAIYGQDTARWEWSDRPTADRIYYHSLMMANEQYNFYTNLRFWVERNGSKELRAKVKMTEKNFLNRVNLQTFTPQQVKAIMKGFVTEYGPLPFGYDLSKEPERWEKEKVKFADFFIHESKKGNVVVRLVQNTFQNIK